MFSRLSIRRGSGPIWAVRDRSLLARRRARPTSPDARDDCGALQDAVGSSSSGRREEARDDSDVAALCPDQAASVSVGDDGAQARMVVRVAFVLGTLMALRSSATSRLVIGPVCAFSSRRKSWSVPTESPEASSGRAGYALRTTRRNSRGHRRGLVGSRVAARKTLAPAARRPFR